jgi:spore germination protein YaaH
VAGRLIYRDGRVVRQVREDAATVGNLAAGTSYSFSVASVDTLGYVGARSKPVQVTTSPPQPTTGHAHAFLLASTDQSFADFRANYRQIGVVYPTYFDCTGAAALIGRDDPLITGWARQRGVRVLPRVNCQSGAVLHRILTEPAMRERWLDDLEALAAAYPYDGLAIDFEAGYAEDRPELTSFIAALAARLHGQGKLLSMAVSAKTRDIPNHARSGFYDYPQLAAHADYIVVMAWGLHWSSSVPGAPDELGWWRDVATYVASMARKEKFLLGMQLYGMDWPGGGGPANPATSYEHADIIKLRDTVGASPVHDSAADAHRFSYEDLTGVDHTVWYTDATTQATRISLARELGVGGVAFWRLGREDQRLWSNALLQSSAGWP